MLEDKINYSVALIKKAEILSLQMSNRGFHLAFSGGKDSIVLYHIAKLAGVKFHAEMQITTLDPPEVMHFIRKEYPDVKLNLPPLSFYKLIKKKKMLPLRQARYCCEVLKEQSGVGSCVLIGIRKSESSRRAKRKEVELTSKSKKKSQLIKQDSFDIDNEITHSCINGDDKVLISPIFNWSDKDIWAFIKLYQLKYPSLYDEGFKRIGCLFCPMGNSKTKQLELSKYPKVADTIKKSIQYLIDNNGYFNNYNATADEIFNWYISNKSAKEYFHNLRNQTELKFK